MYSARAVQRAEVICYDFNAIPFLFQFLGTSDKDFKFRHVFQYIATRRTLYKKDSAKTDI